MLLFVLRSKEYSLPLALKLKYMIAGVLWVVNLKTSIK